MYRMTRRGQLWSLIADVEREALDTWRTHYAGDESVVDALAAYATNVVTRVDRRKGGNVLVTVSVESHRCHLSDQYFFYLQRTGKCGYQRVENTLSWR